MAGPQVNTHGHGGSNVGTDIAPAPKPRAGFGTAGNFQELIMLAIGSMLETDNKKVSLDSQLSQILADADSTLLTEAYTALQKIYNEDIADNTSSSDSGALASGQKKYQLAQTEWQGLEQQAKALVNSATSLTSSDNSNMTNFMQYVTAALQLAGYTQSMLQRQM